MTTAELFLERDDPTAPMALWELHRRLEPLEMSTVALDHPAQADPDAPATGDAQDSPSAAEQRLTDLIEGAGFTIDSRTTSAPGTTGACTTRVFATLRRERTLADTVGPGMRLLIVGLNPSLHAADSGVGFSGPSNRGWPALLAAGLATEDRDPRSLLVDHHIGMTDIVKRATARAAELSSDEYRNGMARLERLCEWLVPAAICVVGLTGWRIAVDRRAVEGVQDRGLGGRPVYAMPNPSGLNASSSLEDLTESFRRAARLADHSR